MIKIHIVGGDMRQITLAELFEQKGYSVDMTGFDKLGINKKAKQKPDYVFLPIPYNNDDGSIKAPFSESKLMLCDIVNECPKSVYIGGFGDTVKKIFNDKSKYVELLQNETFLIRNALLTAEGAVCTYLKNTDKALCDSTCVVAGYGRISKSLCRLLKAFCPKVTATARKDKDLELIRAEGLNDVRTEDVKYVLPEADVVFNTVPFHIFFEAELKSLRKSAKIIELASAPYGMDLELAKELGVNVQIEPGLPGRYFPASAAKAILHAFESEALI